MGEAAAFAHVFKHTGMLEAIQEQVRFACACFGQYDLIDFVAVLIGYILSGEPTLLAFSANSLPGGFPTKAAWKHSWVLQEKQHEAHRREDKEIKTVCSAYVCRQSKRF